MYSIKTTNESARHYDRARQLISIAKDIDYTIQYGSRRISSYPPNFLYEETVNKLKSLGYVVEINDAGYVDISWEKG